MLTRVWCPYRKGDIELVEKLQKRATKLIISLKHLPYMERLKQLKLPTGLTKRRWARLRVSEGCEICLVLQTHWYSICYNSIQSTFVPVFWDGQMDREEAMHGAMAALLVVQNYITTGFIV